MKESSMETKNAASHTPGPWEAWDDDGTGTLPCVLANQVTSFGNFYVAQCNVFADARLVSAAPDLLACLEAAIMECGYNAEGPADALECEEQGDPGWVGHARAAIAKARGTL